MIHYHGSPFSGSKEEVERLKLCMHLYSGKDCGGLVSYEGRGQLDMILKVTDEVALDNGAFSRYKKLTKNLMKMNGYEKIEDIPPQVYWDYIEEIGFDWDKHWTKVYLWIHQHYSKIKWFMIPDVIMGTEEDNDRQIARCPTFLRDKAAPVWHTTESIERLVRLCQEWDLVCIGACGPHHTILSDACQRRLEEAFTEIYVKRDLKVKIHGLRMTDNKVVARFPFYSADSTKVVQCEKYTEKYQPEIKGRAARTVIFKRTMESTKSPAVEEWVSVVKSGIMYPMPRKVITKKKQHPMKYNQWEMLL